MKTLLPLILILALAVACTGIPDEEVRSAEQILTATVTDIASIEPSATSTRVPSQTSTPTISATATPSRTAYPSATLPTSCGTVQLGKPGTQTRESNHHVLIEGT